VDLAEGAYSHRVVVEPERLLGEFHEVSVFAVEQLDDRGVDRFGRTLGLPFAGVHVIEATKQVFHPIAVRKTSRALVEGQPVLVPSGFRRLASEAP
jgi:hypothetical protein